MKVRCDLNASQTLSQTTRTTRLRLNLCTHLSVPRAIVVLVQPRSMNFKAAYKISSSLAPCSTLNVEERGLPRPPSFTKTYDVGMRFGLPRFLYVQALDAGKRLARSPYEVTNCMNQNIDLGHVVGCPVSP